MCICCRAVPVSTQIELVVKSLLLHLRKNEDQTVQVTVRYLAAARPRDCRRKFLLLRLVIELRERDLAHIIRAGCLAYSLACLLNGWKKKADQHSDDRDNDQKLDQRESLPEIPILCAIRDKAWKKYAFVS